MATTSGIDKAFRSVFRRFVNRGVDFSDASWRFRLLYFISDPYRMTSEAERLRFAATNNFLSRHVREIDTILEFGCGEGHQTLQLGKIAKRVIGLDISASAVKRARVRCPDGEFFSGSISALDLGQFQQPVTLVTACEVLYYLSDIESHLSVFEKISKYVLVTYLNVEKYAHRLDSLEHRRPGAVRESIRYGDVEWKMVLWKTGQ